MRREEWKPQPAGEAAASAVALELTLMGVSSLIALAGIGFAALVWLKRRSIAENMARNYPVLHRLLLNKSYVDEIYDAAIVQPIRLGSEQSLWRRLDVGVIDGAVNGTGTIVAARRRPAASAADRFGAVVRRLHVRRRGGHPGLLPVEMMPVLSLSWLVPLVGALLLLLIGNKEGQRDSVIRWVALGVSLATFLVTVLIWATFDDASAEFQFVERARMDSDLRRRLSRGR